jgi:hypothetical protein
MSRSVNIPYFAEPPNEYNRAYFSQLTRAFALYTQQMNTPGPWRATTITLTNVAVFADNAAALAGGLAVGEVYRTATGELRIVI